MCFIGGCVFLRFCMTVKSTRGVQHLRLFACICYLAMIHAGFYRTDCMYTFIVCNTGIMLLLDAMLWYAIIYHTWAFFVTPHGFNSSMLLDLGCVSPPKMLPGFSYICQSSQDCPDVNLFQSHGWGDFWWNLLCWFCFLDFLPWNPAGRL